MDMMVASNTTSKYDLILFFIDFSSYVSSLPAYARSHLELQLDWGHDGVERDLYAVAYHMIKWEEILAAPLGLTEIDIHDITESIYNPVLQR